MQFLMIGRVAEGVSTDKLTPYFKPEAAKVWEYYAAGLIRSMNFMADRNGVVFLWEAADIEQVNEAIAALPMSQSGLLNVEVIPLKNWTGFEQLFEKQIKTNDEN